MHAANWRPLALLAALLGEEAFWAEVDPLGSEPEEPQPASEVPAPTRQSRIRYRTVTSKMR
jgi:hypothetical protein